MKYEQATSIRDETSNEAEEERELVEVAGQMSIFDYIDNDHIQGGIQ